eukprot:CAMPEP_0116858736 /NCGR_PEP_ID=MMETSP0418-20121206/21360_1 /TAXON_ID=1158023 /ORGANISM="Astrosyne radiata, Strain 13vi08-1A" /LENGTH=157 /DNA_ID=CAMNT_0004492735 /DNA_START=551 /DNA_END=1022 /DNA_ORIENTATION=-
MARERNGGGDTSIATTSVVLFSMDGKMFVVVAVEWLFWEKMEPRSALHSDQSERDGYQHRAVPETDALSFFCGHDVVMRPPPLFYNDSSFVSMHQQSEEHFLQSQYFQDDDEDRPAHTLTRKRWLFLGWAVHLYSREDGYRADEPLLSFDIVGRAED